MNLITGLTDNLVAMIFAFTAVIVTTGVLALIVAQLWGRDPRGQQAIAGVVVGFAGTMMALVVFMTMARY